MLYMTSHQRVIILLHCIRLFKAYPSSILIYTMDCILFIVSIVSHFLSRVREFHSQSGNFFYKVV